MSVGEHVGFHSDRIADDPLNGERAAIDLRRVVETGILPNAFQVSPGPEFAVNGILRRYKEMYDVFFEERGLIPAGSFVEIAFEDLERDMIGSVAHIYEAIRLDGYHALEPKLTAYVQSQKDYQKNKHPQIDESLRQRICSTWQRAFDEFGYATN